MFKSKFEDPVVPPLALRGWSTISKSNVADGHHPENRYDVIPQQQMDRFLYEIW